MKAQLQKSVDDLTHRLPKQYHQTIHEERQILYTSELCPETLNL